MLIDRLTLTDLGVLSDIREPHLLANVDQTHSRGGRQRLKELLTQPLGGAEEIRDRQRALQRIATVPLAEAPNALGALLDQVRDYLDSPYLEFPGRAIPRWIVRVRYPAIGQEIFRGLEATRRVLRIATRLRASFEAYWSESRELGEIARKLAAWTDVEPLVALSVLPERGDALRPSPSALAKLDRPIRESAREPLEEVLAGMHELEALCSLAAASARLGYRYPEIVDGPGVVFEARALGHPLLSNAVANDVTLGSAGRLLFVTGPNMAGKSTLLRACGLAVLMAHVGMAVPAETLRISVFDTLFAVLSAQDSLTRGESLFLAEVHRIGALVAHLTEGRRVFAVVDEMFKGTNVHDARDATQLVVSGLAGYADGAFVVASHLVEVASQVDTQTGVRFGQMEVAFRDGAATSTFRLMSGVSSQRLGMYILERQGIVGALAALSQRGAEGSPPPT